MSIFNKITTFLIFLLIEISYGTNILRSFTISIMYVFFNCESLVLLLPLHVTLMLISTTSIQNPSRAKPASESVERKDFVELELHELSTSLNHWLPGSQVLSLLKHLQVFVTMVLSESTSRQTVVPLPIVDERCILESDMISHFEPESVQIIPSFAGFPKSLACKQKYVPFNIKIF